VRAYYPIRARSLPDSCEPCPIRARRARFVRAVPVSCAPCPFRHFVGSRALTVLVSGVAFDEALFPFSSLGSSTLGGKGEDQASVLSGE